LSYQKYPKAFSEKPPFFIYSLSAKAFLPALKYLPKGNLLEKHIKENDG